MLHKSICFGLISSAIILSSSLPLQVHAYSKICLKLDFGVGFCARLRLKKESTPKPTYSRWSSYVCMGEDTCLLLSGKDKKYPMKFQVHALLGKTKTCDLEIDPKADGNSKLTDVIQSGTTLSFHC